MEPARVQYLLTLPPRMAEEFEALEGRRRPDWFASSDPASGPLGSGGGTAQLLWRAWQETGGGSPFVEWLTRPPKLIIHGGGQSRRLPAYAAGGKVLMPIPVFRWSRGQRLNQSLLDLQAPDYERVLLQAGPQTAALVASGDVLLRFGRELPPFPDVDVLGLGMWVAPQQAQHFGVFFSPRGKTPELAFFLQKPPMQEIESLADRYVALVDTGMWLLSGRAVRVLMERCGWDERRQAFLNGQAATYELYAHFGLALGNAPRLHDPEINQLTCAVVPLPEAEFYHFGASRQMIESIDALQHLELDENRLEGAGAGQPTDLVTQNSRFQVAWRREVNRLMWVENSVIPAGWKVASEHVITGAPPNDWKLELEQGICLDFTPVGESGFCVRPYGFDDPFRGELGAPGTRWMNAPVADWFAARELQLGECGLDPATDIQDSRLFPVFERTALDGEFIQWLVASKPATRQDFAQRWKTSPRLSAREICEQANLRGLYQQRDELRNECLVPMLRNSRWSVFYRLDLEATARQFAASGLELPQVDFRDQDPPLHAVHDPMFRAAVLKIRGRPGWEDSEAHAFSRLRELIVNEAQLAPVAPKSNVLEDQIVWARSPARLDLAGGWTDTPPYCLEHGGCVLNLAVDLNGQPPIQVFARLGSRPEIVLRSIDLGAEEHVQSYADLDTYADPRNPFSLAKAALAVAGFLPRFHAGAGHSSLAAQLEALGGGVELSLLAAMPKGSGLGTSSILTATVLAALSELCGLRWDRTVLFSRTMAVEQLLTTGGGWQDQAGAIHRGVKLVETAPGLGQKPTIHWLPSHLFEPPYANESVLLYYTGLTRMAKGILADIVRGMFLNSPQRLAVLSEIAANARATSAAVQRCDYEGLCAGVRRSWELNQRLDSGTNPPAVQSILAQVQDYLGAAKLLGAGGGGYLLLLAKDAEAGRRARQLLVQNPPNPRARFVDLALSNSGLQVTRS